MRNRNYRNIDEVKKSDAYNFYHGLGFTEEQSVLLTMIDISYPFGGGFQDIVEGFDRKKPEDTRSFSKFFCDYVFNPKKLEEDGLVKTWEERRKEIVEDDGAAGSFGGNFASRVSGAVNNIFRAKKSVSARKAKGLAAPEAGAGMPDAIVMAQAAPRPTGMPPAAPMPQANAMMGAAFQNKMSMNLQASMAAPLEAGAVFEAEEEIGFPSLNPENIRTDSYEAIEEKGFRSTRTSPTSTFRTTYNTAAAAVLLANIRSGRNTRHSMVRTEELLNYLDYELAQPEDEMFAVTKELKNEGGKTMLFLGIQGKRTLPKRQNICFLLDVSGSMSGRSDQMIMSMAAVLSRMNDGDIFSLVTYSSTDHVIVNGLKLKKETDLDEIFHTILKNVSIWGGTYGSAGMEKAYEIVQKNKIEDGVNRVIIVTDGDLNFGITDKDGLKGFIEKKKLNGAYFSAIGTGILNLMDDKLETLAKNGTGNYFVVNSQSDIEKSIVGNYESLVFPIAKNVKAQVEFNPAKVAEYRLIGYENRMLNHEDFRDDTVIAEPFGSGSYAIALYELKLAEGAKADSGLKYQDVVLKESEELATLSLRYEDIEEGGFHELSFPVEADLPATENIEKAMSCAELAEKMRDSEPDALTKDRLVRLLG